MRPKAKTNATKARTLQSKAKEVWSVRRGELMQGDFSIEPEQWRALMEYLDNALSDNESG